MSGLYTDILPADSEDAGVSLSTLANAVSTWSWMQQREVTVAQAAATFNTTIDLIRSAVDHHYWMYLDNPEERDPSKQIIQHEGE